MCENANNKISSKSVTMIKAIITELMKLISAALIRMLIIIMITQAAIIKKWY